MILPYHNLKIWATIYEKRVITQIGVFSFSQVPETYVGPQLEIDINQRLIMTDSAGRLNILFFDDFASVMDSDQQTGIGAFIDLSPYLDNIQYSISVPAIGPSTFIADWHFRFNDRIPEQESQKAMQMFENYLIKENLI